MGCEFEASLGYKTSPGQPWQTEILSWKPKQNKKKKKLTIISQFLLVSPVLKICILSVSLVCRQFKMAKVLEMSVALSFPEPNYLMTRLVRPVCLLQENFQSLAILCGQGLKRAYKQKNVLHSPYISIYLYLFKQSLVGILTIYK